MVEYGVEEAEDSLMVLVVGIAVLGLLVGARARLLVCIKVGQYGGSIEGTGLGPGEGVVVGKYDEVADVT